MDAFLKRKNKQEMEQALLLLMEQFRQINQKYGLIVGEQIKGLYQEKYVEMEISRRHMEELHTRL